MIDEMAARIRAIEALRQDGQDVGAVEIRHLPGGWRCWRTSTSDAPTTSHILVRVDGSILRCPSGASDEIATKLLNAQ